MADVKPKNRFASLSLKDLLDAQEAYHKHLSSLENVIATAIGRYRIRKSDPDVNDPAKIESDKDKSSPSLIRTLSNSIVQRWSWPCILVFVNKWASEKELKQPDQFIPRYLYLPDGRIIPTCVVYSPEKKASSSPLQNLTFPNEFVGGGYPVLSDVQGQQHVGSIGCLVTDGDLIFGLTNRHVTGQRTEFEKGRKLYTFINGQRQEIGISDYRQIGKKPFNQIYKDWSLSDAYSNIDAGLIRINDLDYWTSQVFGIGEIDEPVDMNSISISLELIGLPVRSFGAASGNMVGEIIGLFYRYKSMGGRDYISDVIIGKLNDLPLNTQHGDSGTIWFYDPRLRDSKLSISRGKRASRLSPIALQWGGHTFFANDSDHEYDFVLATFLSTICRELDVDIVRDWDVGYSEYWGKFGHYKIAASSCEIVKGSKLQKLLKSNLGAISFEDDALIRGDFPKMGSKAFVALADVPDLVWRQTRKKDEGNHFADMDEEGKGNFIGKTLFDLSKNDVDIDTWNAFYDSIDVGYKRGALPFRVWQFYNDMVSFVQEKKVEEYVCAVGILAHYVGDACQPLHVSKLHHGNPNQPNEKKVHSDYETKMMDRYAVDFVEGVNKQIDSNSVISDIKGGKKAALETINLMKQVMKILPPEKIVQVFNDAPSGGRISYMFDKLNKKTIDCLVEGSISLASIWSSAWNEGNGKNISDELLIKVDQDYLQELYMDTKFLPAYRLTDPKFKELLS